MLSPFNIVVRTFQGAIIKEQGVTFAVILVDKVLIENRSEAVKTVASLRTVFAGLPVVLVAQDCKGKRSCFGRADLARLLLDLPADALTWQEYSLS